MFDLGATEVLLVAVTTLIVVKPKDLPQVFRSIGNGVGKLKSIRNEFTKTINQEEINLKIQEDLKKIDEDFERPKFDFASIEQDIKDSINSSMPEKETPKEEASEDEQPDEEGKSEEADKSVDVEKQQA